jgi:hypothetical protein
MKKLGTAVLAAVIGLSLGVLAQTVRIDGRWENTVEMSMAGVNMKMPATTTTTCITKEEAADPQKLVPQGPGAPTDCKVSDYKVVDNKVTYNVACTSPQPMTMTAEITYGSDTSTGTMTSQTSRGGKPMTMIMKTTGKRLGDCVK